MRFSFNVLPRKEPQLNPRFSLGFHYFSHFCKRFQALEVAVDAAPLLAETAEPVNPPPVARLKGYFGNNVVIRR